MSGQILGEGSALGSLGVKGKDHAPKTSSMMVSSGSESDSEDSLDEQLFGPKTAKVPDALREYNANRAMPAKVRGPVKKHVRRDPLKTCVLDWHQTSRLFIRRS